MKLSISLVPLAISTLASAYCVSPSLQPTIAEDQEVIVKSLNIPGQNRLEYCSSEFEQGPVYLLNVDLKFLGPAFDGPVEADIHGILSFPTSYGTQFRVFDWATLQDLAEPVDYGRFLKENGAQVPYAPGPFHVHFRFNPRILGVFLRDIGVELIQPGGRKLLCVKIPAEIIQEENGYNYHLQ